VLVEPLGPRNVGSVARLCANFAIDQLRLVAPRCDPFCGEARQMAVHGVSHLERAVIFPDLAAALADCHRVVATTGRQEGAPLPLRLPGDALAWLLAAQTPSAGEAGAAGEEAALVFGREDRGLSNGELLQAGCLLHIPAAATYPSLNLSHAVAVVLHHLWSLREAAGGDQATAPTTAPSGPLASPRASEPLGSLQAPELLGSPETFATLAPPDPSAAPAPLPPPAPFLSPLGSPAPPRAAEPLASPAPPAPLVKPLGSSAPPRAAEPLASSAALAPTAPVVPSLGSTAPPVAPLGSPEPPAPLAPLAAPPAPNPRAASAPLALRGAIEGALTDAEALLLEVGFLHPHTARARMAKLRALLQRAQLTDNDVALLRGMVCQLRWASRRGVRAGEDH